MTQDKLNSYLSLSTQFYDAIRPEPPQDAYNFYRNYVIHANGLVLEPMCGTGRFLLPLLKEGFNIQGFDASPHMLEALKVKGATQYLNPTVWLGFVEDLKREERYNLIFIPSGSLGHIIDLEAVKKSLKIFYDHLNKDGILLFEAESSVTVPTELGVWRGLVCEQQDGKMIIVNRLTTFKDSVCYSIDRYELVEFNQIIQTEIEVFNVRLYDKPQVLIDMLEEIGFREIRTIKAFDTTTSPDINDMSVVYECRK